MRMRIPAVAVRIVALLVILQAVLKVGFKIHVRNIHHKIVFAFQDVSVNTNQTVARVSNVTAVTVAIVSERLYT